MKNVRFAVVHHASSFQNLVSLFERDRLTGEEFLIRARRRGRLDGTEGRKAGEISEKEGI